MAYKYRLRKEELKLNLIKRVFKEKLVEIALLKYRALLAKIEISRIVSQHCIKIYHRYVENKFK